MSKGKVYTTSGGTKIFSPKLYVFATTSKAGNVTDRYMIKGLSDKGVVKTSFIGKDNIKEWGKAERMTAKPAKARKSCKTKFEECEAKKSEKRASKKKSTKKTTKKTTRKPKDEDTEEEDSLDIKEDSVELDSPESSSEEEEKPKPKPKRKPAKKSKAKARTRKD
jgi:hypothetical protein